MKAPFGAGLVRKRNEERRRGPWKEITDWHRRSHGRALIGDYDTVQYVANLPHNWFKALSVTLPLAVAARKARGDEPSGLIQSSNFFPDARNSGTLIGTLATAGPC